ncbi:fimbrial protein [Enterobacteriaceae bacterium C34A]
MLFKGKLLASLLFLPMAFAWGESVSISGNVTASPCTVDTGTVSQTVELGSLPRQDVLIAGAAGEWQNFELTLKDCPASTTKVTSTFQGTQDTQDTSAWKNTGTSSNVALRLASRDHATVYSVDSTQQVDVNAGTHSAVFLLSAKMFTPQGNAKPGTFVSVVNVDFTYQ